MGRFILVYLIIFFIVVAIQMVIARKFETIAFEKGYDTTIHSFAMCFWLGLVGYLYVIALPDLHQRMNQKQIISLLSSESTAKNQKGIQ